MPPRVLIHNASVRRNKNTMLDSVFWTLEPGQHWAVLGNNGAGKSTFLRLVRGDIWPDQDGRGRRRYAFDGRPSTSPLGARERMGLVSAEIQAHLVRIGPNAPAREVVAAGLFDSPLLYTTLSPEQWERVDALLDFLGVADEATTPLHALSQGQARAVVLARALAALRPGPSLLLLDEVAESLDQQTRTAVLQALEELAAGRAPACLAGCSPQFLVATHRPDELPGCLTHAIALEAGRVAAQGPFAEVVAHRSVRALAEPEPVVAAPPDARPAPRQDGAPLVEIVGADVYLDRVRVLRNITWRVDRGSHWAVLGPNGAGKTTLLKLVQGEVRAAFGATVRRFGRAEPVDLRELRRRIGYVSADLQAGYEHDLTGLELVCSGFFATVGLYDRPTARMRDRAMGLLEDMGLSDLADRRIAVLSYGQFRRLLLARALAPDPELLLLDEPCAGLDQPSRLAFLEELRRLARNGPTLVYVTHYAGELIDPIGSALILEQGSIVARGPRRRVLGH
jgi:molybdate transport system ATP-binding protein